MKHIVIAILSILMISCSKTKAPLMQAPPEKFQQLNISAGEVKQIEKPKVEVLFVVDNSGSMKPHQETLQKNIDAFADIFFSNSRIEAKVGVVPVYDRKYLNDRMKNRFGQERVMNPYGELVALKNPDGSKIDSVPYITSSTPNAKEVLKATVAIDVQWGPEAEESFSPVLEIIQNKELNSTKNAGFYEKDAHLFIIFLTDADDATPGLSAEEFYEKLVQEKSDPGTDNGREKVHIAMALANPDKKSATCPIDGDGPVYKFPELQAFSRAYKADLCSSDFGKKFAQYAQEVANSIAQQRIRLEFLPDVSFEITYGVQGSTKEERQVVPDTNYKFYPETNEFILPADLGIQPIENGQLFIHATPVQLRNIGNGRLNTL